MQKTMITLLTFFITQMATAIDFTDPSLLVDSKLKIRYYENQMPVIIDNPAPKPQPSLIVYNIEATVHLCRTVSSSEFDLIIQEINGVNVMALYSKFPFADCFGPKQTQILSYGMDDKMNTSLPFVQIQPVEKIYEGVIH